MSEFNSTETIRSMEIQKYEREKSYYDIDIEFLQVLITYSTKEKDAKNQIDEIVTELNKLKLTPKVVVDPTYEQMIASVKALLSSRETISGILIMILGFGEVGERTHQRVMGDILRELNSAKLDKKPKVLLAQSCQPPTPTDGFHYEIRKSEILVIASKKGSAEDHFFLRKYVEALVDPENINKDLLDLGDVVSRKLISNSPTPAFEARSSMAKKLVLNMNRNISRGRVHQLGPVDSKDNGDRCRIL